MIQVMSAPTVLLLLASACFPQTFNISLSCAVCPDLQDHYCVVLAVNDASGVLHDFKFKQKVPIPAVPQFPRT